MKTLQTTFIRSIALRILGSSILEKTLCFFSSKALVRKGLKLGVIPMAYTYILSKPEVRIAKLGHYRFYVNIAEYSGVSLYFFSEHNEPFSAWLVSKLINKGDLCLDIGANLGSYTFLMAHSTGSEGKVFAFEPNPNLYRFLKDSVNLNQADRFIFVDPRALYSKSGQSLRFYLSNNPSNSGTSSLVNHGVFVCEKNCVIVETVSLKDYFIENKIEKCKLIKIDVERAEQEVLKGMMDLLRERRIDYIVLEQLAGSESQKILDSVAYTGWLIDETRKNLLDINQVELGSFANYLFVSPNFIDEFKFNYRRYIKS
jgi:FkbM family methyltransferase